MSIGLTVFIVALCIGFSIVLWVNTRRLLLRATIIITEQIQLLDDQRHLIQRQSDTIEAMHAMHADNCYCSRHSNDR
jgi:hypothetical protein